MTTSSDSSREPNAESRARSSAPARTSSIRAIVWIALAVVIAIGVVLYFRHQEDVTPLLGATSAADSSQR